MAKAGVRALTVPITESLSIDVHGVKRDLDKKTGAYRHPYYLRQSSMGAR